MRRWLIVTLALQIFCSASVFAFGSTKLDLSSTESNTFAISMVVEESKILQDEHPSVLDAEHDLFDEKPDLPEWLGLTWYRLFLAEPWDVPQALVSPDWAPPTLAGPQRPPQA